MRERARIGLSFRPSSSGVACLMPLLAEEEWRWISERSGRQVGCRIRWTGRQHPKRRKGSEDLSSGHCTGRWRKRQQRQRRKSIWGLAVCVLPLSLPQPVRVGLCFLIAMVSMVSMVSISPCASQLSHLLLFFSLWTFRCCFSLFPPSVFPLCTLCPCFLFVSLF